MSFVPRNCGPHKLTAGVTVRVSGRTISRAYQKFHSGQTNVYLVRPSFAGDLDRVAILDAHHQPGKIGAQCSSAKSREN